MEFVTMQKDGKMLLYEGFKYTVNCKLYHGTATHEIFKII